MKTIDNILKVEDSILNETQEHSSASTRYIENKHFITTISVLETAQVLHEVPIKYVGFLQWMLQ